MSFIELKFQVMGKRIPADHGYFLYSALSGVERKIHDLENIAICGISGMPDASRNLHLNSASKLRIRIDHSDLPALMPLAGKTLQIGGEKITLGIPAVSLLKPHRHLYSRLVTVKGCLEEKEFLEAVQRKLGELEITAEALLFHKENGNENRGIRKTVRVKDKEIVGFPVLIHDLEPVDSLLLQQVGLGGRRKMGCGSFVGVRG